MFLSQWLSAMTTACVHGRSSQWSRLRGISKRPLRRRSVQKLRPRSWLKHGRVHRLTRVAASRSHGPCWLGQRQTRQRTKSFRHSYRNQRILWAGQGNREFGKVCTPIHLAVDRNKSWRQRHGRVRAPINPMPDCDRRHILKAARKKVEQ